MFKIVVTKRDQKANGSSCCLLRVGLYSDGHCLSKHGIQLNRELRLGLLESWRKIRRRGTTYTERQKEEIQERGRRKIVEDHDCGGRLIRKNERDGIVRSLKFKLE